MFVAFGSLDIVAIDTILQGKTFSFEFLNYSTGKTQLTTVYGYEEIGNLLLNVIDRINIQVAKDIVTTLINIMHNVLGFIGHALYVVLFGTPMSMPMWLGLILFTPRLIVLRWALGLVQSVVHYVT